MKVRARSSQRGARGWCVSTYVGVRALLRVSVCGCMCVGEREGARMGLALCGACAKSCVSWLLPAAGRNEVGVSKARAMCFGVETVGDFVCVCGAESARARSRELGGVGPRARRQSRFVSP